MTLRWNPDAGGKRSIPERLIEFGRRKRAQFLVSYMWSAVAGLGIGLGLSYYSTNWDGQIGEGAIVLWNALWMVVVMIIALFGMLFA